MAQRLWRVVDQCNNGHLWATAPDTSSQTCSAAPSLFFFMAACEALTVEGEG
jgi:hypothetical protein